MQIRFIGSLILWGACLTSLHTAQSDQTVTITRGGGGQPRTPDFNCCGVGNTLTVVNNFGGTITMTFNGSGSPINIQNGRSHVFNATAALTDFYTVFAIPSQYKGSELANCKPGKSLVANGSGINPLILTSVQPPHIKKPWSVELDCTGADPSKFAIVLIGSPAEAPVVTSLGERLISLTPGSFVTFATPHAGGAVTPSSTVPNDPSVACLRFRVQGLCGDAPRGFLSNALNETIGM